MNWKNKRVLITGGLGMIGLELYEQLDDLGAIISVADLKDGQDLINFEVCRLECLEKDYVFHLAGVKGSPKMTNERPVDFMAPMLGFDRNMIVAAQQRNVKRFLYTSSIAVENPESDKYPAWAKMTSEMLIEAMRIQYPEDSTKYCIVRPANVYGRYDDFSNPNAMVITSMINNAMAVELELWGEGNQVRDFINSKDVARGMIKAMEDMPEKPVNLCSGEGVTIKRVVELIAEYVDVPLKKVSIEGQVMGDDRRVMELNWDFKPHISIEEGLREVIEHVKNNA